MTTISVDYSDAAEELIQELVRVVKVRRLYGADHPQRAGVEENALDRIGELLDRHGAIELRVEESRFKVEDEIVFRAESSRESLPWILHKEGIRQIAFYQGLTIQELVGFVQNVARVAGESDDEDDDLVTRLWEENFYHLRYTFVEQLQDEEWTPPSAEGEEVGLEEGPAVRVDPRDTAEVPEAIRRIREADSSLYFLDDDDMAALQAEIEAEKKRSLIDECLTVLRELLMRPVAGSEEAILSALADMHGQLLDDADYGHVQKLHQLFIPYLESDRVTERGREAFRALRAEALGEEALAILAARLEAKTVEDRVAASYYRAFAREDPATLLARIGDLKRLCQRPAISSALSEIARERPDALREAIRGADPAAAGAAAFLAGHVGDPRMVEPLGEALGGDDPQIRREAIQALKQVGGGRALEAVARAVDDSDPGVRLYALRHLVAHRYEPAFDAIAAMVEGEGWRERSSAEQRLLFEAYGALGGDRVVDDLAGRVKPGGFFKKADPEEAACAIVGLGAAGTHAARAVVERAADDRHALVARTARQVLDDWGAEPEDEP